LHESLPRVMNIKFSLNLLDISRKITVYAEVLSKLHFGIKSLKINNR